MKIASTLTAFVILICCSASAYSQIYTIEITGHVTQNGSRALAGTPFTGTYSYDSASTDSNPAASQGQFAQNSPCGVSISLGGYQFETVSSHTGQFVLNIDNDYGSVSLVDHYKFFSTQNMPLSDGYAVTAIQWTLSDFTAAAISSTDLPSAAPDLSKWSWNYFYIEGTKQSNYFQIVGTVDEAHVVPEPASAILLTAGLCLFRRRVNKRK